MRKFNLELMIRGIVQDELAKSFGIGDQNEPQDTQSEPIQAKEESEDPSDEIVLAPLNKGKNKNFGRGRVTSKTDGRLKANKK